MTFKLIFLIRFVTLFLFFSDGTNQGPPSLYSEVTTYNFSALHLTWETWQAFGPTAQTQKSSSNIILSNILLIFLLFLNVN